MLTYPNAEIQEMRIVYYMIIHLDDNKLKVTLKFNYQNNLLSAAMVNIPDYEEGEFEHYRVTLELDHKAILRTESDIDKTIDSLRLLYNEKTNQGNDDGPPRPRSV